MQPKFQVTLQRAIALSEIPSDWGIKDYYDILRLTNYDDSEDLDEQEVKGMALFCLSNLEKEEAASLLLEYVFPEDAFSQEDIEEFSFQMEEERLWENFPVPSQQRNFFRVGSLLYRAYNGGFPKPEARQITLQVRPLNKSSEAYLRRPTAKQAIELLNGGHLANSPSGPLGANPIAEDGIDVADTVIWSVKSYPNGDGTFKVVILGPTPSLAGYSNAVSPYETANTLDAAVSHVE